MRVVKKYIWQVSAKERKRLFYLHARGGSIVDVFINNHYRQDDLCKVSYIIYNKKIIGWGILYYNNYYERSNSVPKVQLYVQRKYRRKGFGTKIFKSLTRNIKENVKVFKYGAFVPEFFDSKKIKNRIIKC